MFTKNSLNVLAISSVSVTVSPAAVVRYDGPNLFRLLLQISSLINFQTIFESSLFSRNTQ